MIGFGTKDFTSADTIQRAIDAGYTFFDTKDSNRSISHFKTLQYDRTKVFLCSKLMGEGSPENHAPSAVRTCCLDSLERGGLEYWDLYFIHTAHSFGNVSILETYNELLKLKEEGLCKHVGISNLTYEQLEAICYNTTKPDYIQIEIHPYLTENRILDYCKAHDIKVIAHSPLGSMRSRDIAQDPMLIEMSTKYKITVAQLILNWHISRGVLPIPSSNTPVNIKNNLLLVTLSLDDLEAITNLNKNKRVWIKPNHYEAIGPLGTPLPKRTIRMEDRVSDTTIQGKILNEIIEKGFYVSTTSVDEELHALCKELVDEPPTAEIASKLKTNSFLQRVSNGYSPASKLYAEIRIHTPTLNLTPVRTGLYHRDLQLQKCLKCILYLTDVGKENGPLKIVYPEPDVELTWYRDQFNGRATPEEVHQKMPTIHSVEGPAFTMILFEGSLLHSGGYVQKGSRKVVYMEFLQDSHVRDYHAGRIVDMMT